MTRLVLRSSFGRGWDTSELVVGLVAGVVERGWSLVEVTGLAEVVVVARVALVAVAHDGVQTAGIAFGWDQSAVHRVDDQLHVVIQVVSLGCFLVEEALLAEVDVRAIMALESEADNREGETAGTTITMDREASCQLWHFKDLEVVGRKVCGIRRDRFGIVASFAKITVFTIKTMESHSPEGFRLAPIAFVILMEDHRVSNVLDEEVVLLRLA